MYLKFEIPKLIKVTMFPNLFLHWACLWYLKNDFKSFQNINELQRIYYWYQVKQRTSAHEELRTSGNLGTSQSHLATLILKESIQKSYLYLFNKSFIFYPLSDFIMQRYPVTVSWHRLISRGLSPFPRWQIPFIWSMNVGKRWSNKKIKLKHISAC